MQDRSFGFATRAIHAGTPPDPATGSRALPIYQTAAFVFGSTEQAAELFQLRSYGHIYSRISNPTVAAFEERMASLEGGLGGIAFSSGLAAQLCTVLALAQAGDHLVCSQNVYGGTVTQFSVTVKRMGIETTFAPVDDFAAIAAAIRPNTKLLFAETIGNPSGTSPISGARGARAQARHPAGGRQHVRLAVPLPPDRARRRYRGALGDEVHQRPRNGDRRRDRRIRDVRFGQRQVSAALRAEPRLSQQGFHRNVRRVRVPDARARRSAARRRRADVADGRVVCCFGLETLPLRMEAHVRNASAIAAFLRVAPRGRLGAPARDGLDLHLRPARRPRSRTPLHRLTRAVEPSRQRRRRQEPGHPPGLHDALAAHR